MGEWRRTSIGEICDEGYAELQTGPFGTQLHAYDYVESGIPIVPTEAIRNRQIDHSILPKIAPEKARELSRHRLSSGDILFARRGVQATGHIGFVREAEDGFICGTGAIRLRLDGGKSNVTSEFLSHVLANPASVTWFKFHAIGATMPNLNEGIIRTFSFDLPPIEEQKAIADILSTLDDKIELNRRMSETLEATARALFKSWFVDFEPVRIKLRGQPTNLPEHLDDLFPKDLTESEIGDVPSNWSVGPLERFFDAVKGVSYKGSGLSDEGMPLHNLNSVYEGGGYKYEGLKHYTGDYGERHEVVAGDVIVANTEQGHDRLLIGYAAIVPKMFGDKGIASHHIYRLRPKSDSPLTCHYLCMVLNSQQMHDIVSGYANGTTVNMLPISGVQRPQIVVPPRGIVHAFDGLARLVFDRCEGVVLENRMLSNLRDTLLPKLISGELRIKDAERFVAEVA